MASVLHAGDYEEYSCSSGNYFSGCVARGKASPWNFGGHIETGLYVNEYGQKNTYNGAGTPYGPDVYSGNTVALQNVHQSDWQFNQGWVYLEKELSGRNSLELGGRVDYVYGTDARYLQSAGLEYDAGHGHWGSGDYYSALAQAYGEVGYGKLSVKMGKFITPLGCDAIVSTDRFFYSLSKNFGLLPVTHTGALATVKFNRHLSVYGGWTNGEGQFFETSRDNALLAGFEYKFNPCTKVGYGMMKGWDEYNFDGEYFVHSLYFSHKFGRWNYTADWALRNMNADNNVNSYGGYGIGNSLYYTINDKWALGFRAEWRHDYNDAYFGSDYDGYGFTFGANWLPYCWLLIRPEIRYDSYHGTPIGPFNLAKSNFAEPKGDQLSGGFSVVVKF